MGFINKIFGTHSQHELKRIKPIVDKILGMREQWVALSDEELQHKTVEFKERLAKGETLDVTPFLERELIEEYAAETGVE